VTKLVEFQTKNGPRVAINPRMVVSIEVSDAYPDCTVIRLPHDRSYLVTLHFDSVVTMLTDD